MKQNDLTFAEAAIPFFFTISVLFLALILHFPLYWGLLMGSVLAMLIALKKNFILIKLMNSGLTGLKNTLPVSSILLIISLLVASWMSSGTVAALIRLGISILNPSTLLVTGFWLTLLLSLLLGTAVGTLSTLGVALLGIGMGLGIPAPLMAGALISGAAVGDRTSPFGGTCNLLSSVSGLSLRQTVKALFPSTALAVIATSLLYAFWGRSYGLGEIHTETLIRQLQDMYQLNIWLFLPPFLVLVGVILKLPTKLSLTLGALSGLFLAYWIQNATLSGLSSDLLYGYHLHSGTSLDTVMSGGGLIRMFPTFLLISSAGIFNGIMSQIGALEILTRGFLGRINHPELMKFSGMGLSVTTALVVSNQAVPILLSGPLLLPHFRRLHLTPAALVRTLGDSSVVLSACIPWNMFGILISSTLNIPTLTYTPYAVFLWILPLITLLTPIKRSVTFFSISE